MDVVEVLETFKAAHKLVARIQFIKGAEPNVGAVYSTATGQKIRIIGIEFSISGDEKQQENWQKQRASGVFGCSIEYID
jgi:hypothetical protein